MTSAQRLAHLVLWLVLGLAALVGLGFALVNRPPVPVQQGPLPGAQMTIEGSAADPAAAPAIAPDSGDAP